MGTRVIPGEGSQSLPAEPEKQCIPGDTSPDLSDGWVSKNKKSFLDSTRDVLHRLGIKKKKATLKDLSASRFAHVNDRAKNRSYQYVKNVVTTSKYTWYSFTPKFMIEAFSKFANSYFLVVSILQTIPSISITNGIPYNLGPLMIVLAVEALAALLEDRQRHHDDKVANNSLCHVLDTDGSFKCTYWSDLQVGNIIRLKNRQAVPADLLILHSTNDSGICYVETKSLDGETNLKLRQGISTGIPQSRDVGASLTRLRGTIEYQQPDAQIDSFSGFARMTLPNGDTMEKELVAENLLLRGCVLRNTDVMYGFILNCGHDTKIMMSAKETCAKLSDLDNKINRYILWFVLVELFLCVVSTIWSMIWMKSSGESAYYLYLEPFVLSQFFERVLTFFLLIANMIPIALYVAMKFARFFQAQAMMRDKAMVYHPEGEKHPISMKVRTMDLNDALGQVDYLFTDKTGTLTTNVMEFRKCSINGSRFGRGSTTIGLRALEIAGRHEEVARLREEMKEYEQNEKKGELFNFVDDPNHSIYEILNRSREDPENAKVSQFFTALGLCHEVLLEHVRDEDGAETGQVRLSAASPDDQALVTAAKRFGVGFMGTHDGLVTLNYVSGIDGVPTSSRSGKRMVTARTFEILDTLTFSSARRKMSVIVRCTDTKELILFCKGSDDIIFSKLSAESTNKEMHQKTAEHLSDFAKEGLRTLAVAKRNLTEDQYSNWKKRYDEVAQDIQEMELRKRKLPNKIDTLMDEMEEELELLGATAIEDKLQDNVPETIANLADAGIKIWMLTGDKGETAMNIAFACNLASPSMELLRLTMENCPDEDTVLKMMKQYQRDARETCADELGLMIEGPVIAMALGEKCQEEFRALSMKCKAVIACRTSPMQKASLVSLIKDYKAERGSNIRDDIKTLAIGDGANDVPMIQAAHIGVGISGQEGLQAANSAEFSFGQFSYLNQLLLVHGRNNYRRMSKLVVFMFYKNIVLTAAQFFLSFYNGFSGQKFYVELGLQSFNLVYTSLPSFLLAVYDVDLPENIVLQYPSLYCLGQENQLFSARVFWRWIANGFFHATIIYFSSCFLYDAIYHDLWMLGCLVITVVIFVANIKIFFEQSTWRASNVAAWVFTSTLWPITATLLELPMWLGWDWGYSWLYIFRSVVSQPATWIVTLFIFVACFSREFFVKVWERYFHPELYHILQECIKYDLPMPSHDHIKQITKRSKPQAPKPLQPTETV